MTKTIDWSKRSNKLQ